MTDVENPEGSTNAHHQCHVEELCADLIKLLRIWKILTLEILIGRRRHTCPAWISEQLEFKFVVNFSHKCGYSTWSNSSDMSHHRGTENLEITFQQIFSSSISWFIRSRLLSDLVRLGRGMFVDTVIMLAVENKTKYSWLKSLRLGLP